MPTIRPQDALRCFDLTTDFWEVRDEVSFWPGDQVGRHETPLLRAPEVDLTNDIAVTGTAFTKNQLEDLQRAASILRHSGANTAQIDEYIRIMRDRVIRTMARELDRQIMSGFGEGSHDVTGAVVGVRRR